jgi:hypothetical protein
LQAQSHAAAGQEQGEAAGRGPGLIGLNQHDGQIAGPDILGLGGAWDREVFFFPLQGKQMNALGLQVSGAAGTIIQEPDIFSGGLQLGGQQTADGPGADNDDFQKETSSYP